MSEFDRSSTTHYARRAVRLRSTSPAAFARLGSRVTLIEAMPTVLGLEEPEAGAALRPHLEADGMMLMIGDPCVAVEKPLMGPSHQRWPSFSYEPTAPNLEMEHFADADAALSVDPPLPDLLDKGVVWRERLTLTLADRYKGIEDTFVQ